MDTPTAFKSQESQGGPNGKGMIKSRGFSIRFKQEEVDLN